MKKDSIGKVRNVSFLFLTTERYTHDKGYLSFFNGTFLYGYEIGNAAN